MNTATRKTKSTESTRPETPAALPSKKFSPGLLLLAFFLNALIAMGVVISFGQFRGVSLLTVVVLLFWMGIALTLWATHEILLGAIRSKPSDEDIGEASSLIKILTNEWKLLRDGFPTEYALKPRQLFVATLSYVLLYAGVIAGLCMEGANSWPKISPFVDVIIAVLGGVVLVKFLPAEQIHLRRVLQIIGEVIHSPNASRIRWALLIAGNLLTSAYGLVAVLPFWAANECPFALAFLVLSAVPLSILGFSVVVLLVPALTVLDESAATTNSN